MNRLISALMLTASLGLVCVVPAGAQGMAQGMGNRQPMQGDMVYGCGMMGGGMMGGGMMGGMLCGMADGYDWEMIAEELDLAEDQENQIMMNNRDTVRNMMDSKNTLSLKMFDLNTELKRAQPDQARVDKLVDEIAALQKQVLEGRVEAVGRMREILTPDQWNRFTRMPMMMHNEQMPMMRRGRGMHMMR